MQLVGQGLGQGHWGRRLAVQQLPGQRSSRCTTASNTAASAGSGLGVEARRAAARANKFSFRISSTIAWRLAGVLKRPATWARRRSRAASFVASAPGRAAARAGIAPGPSLLQALGSGVVLVRVAEGGHQSGRVLGWLFVWGSFFARRDAQQLLQALSETH
ncbi:hypothetical protein ACFQT0_03135 [Hymenobacter humi]|uniref:Uncharacterized protein n=1 Tax=Hymenobacter humi TaxID=1411620 RepID=A0ABW2U0X3_9BACT